MGIRYQKVKKHLVRIKRLATLPNLIIVVGVLTMLIYIFSYLFPFTDNSFFVNNFRPVAAQVEGYITDIYVKNGESVKKGQKLLSVFKLPYQYTVARLQADLAAEQAKLSVFQASYNRDRKLCESRQKIYTKLEQDDKKYQKGYAAKSVSQMTLQNSQQDTQAAHDEWLAALEQLEIDQHQIEAQRKVIESMAAQLNLAEVNLRLTDVFAQKEGVVQNLFFSIGSPITINQPLFALVDTDEIYIQANFNETDLRNVRHGSNALIFPRMYLGRKMFHGVVDSDYWSANRQRIDPRSQLQNVSNENQWILLPQRLPVMIKITDPDPRYPLRIGSSAYVYIKTG